MEHMKLSPEEIEQYGEMLTELIATHKLIEERGGQITIDVPPGAAKTKISFASHRKTVDASRRRGPSVGHRKYNAG
jgi:hypothetical protein